MTWISATEGARRLGIGRPLFARIVKAAGVRQRRMPGECRPRYSAEDIDRIEAESVASAGQLEEASVAS